MTGAVATNQSPWTCMLQVRDHTRSSQGDKHLIVVLLGGFQSWFLCTVGSSDLACLDLRPEHEDLLKAHRYTGVSQSQEAGLSVNVCV